MSTLTSIFGTPPPRKKRSRFEEIQRLISQTKILVVEIASLLGLIAIILEGLKHELKW